MEKLDLQIFRALRQEIIDYINKFREAEERGEYLSDEEGEQFQVRYKEIIEILSEHDLSDIDFEEWRGMALLADEDNPLDFSKTKITKKDVKNIKPIKVNIYLDKIFPQFNKIEIINEDNSFIYSIEQGKEQVIIKNEEDSITFTINRNKKMTTITITNSKDVSRGNSI